MDMDMDIEIKTVRPEDFSDFYWEYLFDKRKYKPTKNGFQLFESKTNAKDNPVKYFNDDGGKGSAYFFAFAGDLLVGQLSLKQSPFTENILWFTGISVDPKFQKQGIATKLINAGFQFASNSKKEILMSYYVDDVKDFLPKIIKKKAIEYRILVHERDDNYQYFSHGIDSLGNVVSGAFFRGEKKF